MRRDWGHGWKTWLSIILLPWNAFSAGWERCETLLTARSEGAAGIEMEVMAPVVTVQGASLLSTAGKLAGDYESSRERAERVEIVLSKKRDLFNRTVDEVIIPNEIMAEITSMARAFVGATNHRGVPLRAPTPGNEEDSLVIERLTLQVLEVLMRMLRVEVVRRQLECGLPYHRMRLNAMREDFDLFALFAGSRMSLNRGEKISWTWRSENPPKLAANFYATRAVFHRIEPGRFYMGDRRVEVVISRAYEMMATPVTQFIWQRVAELTHAKFPNRYRIAIEPSLFRGESHPVESLTYDAVQIWIAALNELSTAHEAKLKDLIPDHHPGDFYRLPTEAEWEFVAHGRGSDGGQDSSMAVSDQLLEYAWLAPNSGGQTHPVAQKQPFIVNGKSFFDFYGNVWEWVQDWYDKDIFGGRDPQGPTSGQFRVKRGGSIFSENQAGEFADRGFAWSHQDLDFVGFRLVRTRPTSLPAEILSPPADPVPLAPMTPGRQSDGSRSERPTESPVKRSAWARIKSLLNP